MNEYKKSLNQLIAHIPEETLNIWAQDFEYYIDNMQELVDRTTPMEPMYKMNSYNYSQPYCGRCNSMIENSYKYCHYCGQAIDWSER